MVNAYGPHSWQRRATVKAGIIDLACLAPTFIVDDGRGEKRGSMLDRALCAFVVMVGAVMVVGGLLLG